MCLLGESKTDRLMLKFIFVCGVALTTALALADQKPKNPPPSNNTPSRPAQQSAPRSNSPQSGNRGPAPNRNSGNGNGNMSRGNNNTGGNGRNNQSNGMNNRNQGAGGQNSARGNERGANNTGGMNNRGGMNNNARGEANNNNRGGMNKNVRGETNKNRGGMNNTRGADASRPNVARRGPPTTTREIRTRSGATVHASFRGGQVRSIQAHNMRIDHGIHGGRRIVSEHNGRRVVSMGPHRGYTQRAYYSRGGRVYVQRTYYVGGRQYAYAYRTYYYGGRPYYGYAPAYYYQPVYYGWAYNPWPAPVAYRWGYYNDPWYGYYGYYYNPYPVYPSASLWLTDYLIAASLRAAYEAQSGGLVTPGLQNDDSKNLTASLFSSDPLINASLSPYSPALIAVPAAASQAQLSPEVKRAIAEEVKSQISAEKSAAEKSDSGGDNGPPAALDPQHRTFVVSSDIDTSTDDGDDCSLSAGDVIYRTGDTPDNDNNVGATVKSSKKDECQVGANVSVDADDLQEMHNHLRETLDEGLKDLASKQGKDGLPAAPDTHTTAGEVPPPSADTNVGSDLQTQQKDADQTEADVNSSGSQ